MKNDYCISHTKDNRTSPIYFHSHDFYEIYLFMDGNVKYYIENESYVLSRGNILIIPPGKLHRPVFDGDFPYERYVLWIYHPKTLANTGIRSFIDAIDQMAETKNTRLASFEAESQKALTDLFDRLLTCFYSKDPLASYTGESCILFILDAILQNLKRQKRVTEESKELIPQVISYINQNIAHAPCLDALSARFFVSKYHLSHKFKEHTKTTIHQYILMKKVNLAKELLKMGLSPQEVSVRCGFSTYSNFYKVFTGHTGMSPKQFYALAISSLKCYDKINQ